MNESDCLEDRDPVLSGNVNGALEKPIVGMCMISVGQNRVRRQNLVKKKKKKKMS